MFYISGFCVGCFILGSWSYWAWPENTTCAWAWWTCSEMCTWSKWKSCNTEVYRMHSHRENWIYHFCFSRPSFHTFYSSLWLSRHTGNGTQFSIVKSPIRSCVSHFETIHFYLIESFGALFRWHSKSIYSWWNLRIYLRSCSRPVWELCYPGWCLYFVLSVVFI